MREILMRCGTRFYLGVTCLLSALLPLPWRAGADEGDSQIKADERVLFFPTAARRDAQSELWHIPVHGWIFEPEQDSVSRRMAIRRLRSMLGLAPNEPETVIFQQRALGFLVDNERGKSIEIRIAGQSFVCDPSDTDGHFTGNIRLPDSLVQRDAENGRLHFAAVTQASDRRTFEGNVFLCHPEGVSVISDIDDTIKVSNVHDKKQLLRRTFLEPFEAVSGMSATYRRWAAAGAQFHYVSASPWHLYEPLSSFLRQERFPNGTFHLKRFRVKDASVTNLFADPVAYKQSVIENLLTTFPDRQFLFVGDSGEKDPEVYGLIARKYPRQIVTILIRDVTGQPRDDPRYQAAFASVPTEKWSLFQDAALLDVSILDK